MAFDFNGTTQFISATSAPATAVPITFAAWFNTDRSTGYEVCVSLAQTGLLTDHFFGDISNLQIRAAQRGNGVEANALSASFTTGQWRLHCVVFETNAARNTFLDGTAGSANTSSVSPTATLVNNFRIGCRTRTTDDGFFDGDIAEVAIWSAALTQAEITSLAKGFCPRRVRPQSLVLYSPLLRNLQDVRQARSLTNNNSASVSDHPRVY